MQIVSPRPVSFRSIDVDVQAWEVAIIAAGGSLSTYTRTAANAFVRTVKAAGLWDKLYMADLCAGEDLTSMLVRLKVPAGVSRSYTNVNFVAGDYTETGASGGLKGNGSSKYLNSGINPSALSYSVSSFGMFAYVRETGSAGTSQATMGCQESATAKNSITGWLNGGAIETGVIAGSSTAYAGGSGTSQTGLFGAVVNGTRQTQFYKNGETLGAAADAASDVFFNGNIFCHAVNINGTPGAYASRRISSKFVASGMSTAEVAAFYASVLAFETALGRNV